MAAFVPNPLSLGVPEPAFEDWLRDNGYLEVLDNGADPPAAASAAAVAPDPSVPRSSPSSAGFRPGTTAADALSALGTIASLFTLNPFAKVSAEDIAGGTPSWTLDFVGAAGSYSWPAGPSQARMRVQENVRRYARNYVLLSVLIFACSLYKMPVSLLGVISCLVLWEFVRFCCDKWNFQERSPALKHALIRGAQIATAVILYICNLQLAVACSFAVSYAVIVLHAFLRKLTPKRTSEARRFLHKR